MTPHPAAAQGPRILLVLHLFFACAVPAPVSGLTSGPAGVISSRGPRAGAGARRPGDSAASDCGSRLTRFTGGARAPGDAARHGVLYLRGGQQQQQSAGDGRRAMISFQKRGLFGGAIDLKLPESFEDISKIRPIPDNQEVFVDRFSDDSLIVEVLESVEAREQPADEGDEEGYNAQKAEQKRLDAGRHAAETIFMDIASCNNSTETKILGLRRLRDEEVPLLMRDVPCPKSWITLWVMTGTQVVSKFRGRERPQAILVCVFVARLPNVESDVVISLNLPMDSDADIPIREDQGRLFLGEVLKTLEVRNWDFFGGEYADEADLGNIGASWNAREEATM